MCQILLYTESRVIQYFVSTGVLLRDGRMDQGGYVSVVSVQLARHQRDKV